MHPPIIKFTCLQNESLEPFDLGLPSLQVRSGDSISISEIVRQQLLIEDLLNLKGKSISSRVKTSGKLNTGYLIGQISLFYCNWTIFNQIYRMAFSSIMLEKMHAGKYQGKHQELSCSPRIRSSRWHGCLKVNVLQ